MALDTYNASVVDMDQRNYDDSLAAAMEEEGLAALKESTMIGGEATPVYNFRNPSGAQREALATAQFEAGRRQVGKLQRKKTAAEMASIRSDDGAGKSLLDIATERATGTSAYELSKKYKTGPISMAEIQNQAASSGRRHGSLSAQDYLQNATRGRTTDQIKESIRNLNVEYHLRKPAELEEDLKDANLDDLVQTWAQLVGSYRAQRDNFGV